MLSLDSHVTLAVIFSFIAMLSQFINIYVSMHNRAKETTDKEVKSATLFSRLDTKLDFQSQRLDDIGKAVDKTDQKLDDISSKFVRQDERISSLEKRVDRLEGK